MKVQAQDLKIGQDAKFGNYWIKIENLIDGVQGNGKGFIQVCGTVYGAVIKRRGYKSNVIESHYNDCNRPKLQTKVTVR